MYNKRQIGTGHVRMVFPAATQIKGEPKVLNMYCRKDSELSRSSGLLNSSVPHLFLYITSVQTILLFSLYLSLPHGTTYQHWMADHSGQGEGTERKGKNGLNYSKEKDKSMIQVNKVKKKKKKDFTFLQKSIYVPLEHLTYNNTD